MPMRESVMLMLSGAVQDNSSEAKRRLQTLPNARKDGQYVDLIQFRAAILDVLREANAIDDIASTASVFDELPPEDEKIVYPDGRPKRGAPGSTSHTASRAPTKPDPILAKRREFFDSIGKVGVYGSVQGWTKFHHRPLIHPRMTHLESDY